MVRILVAGEYMYRVYTRTRRVFEQVLLVFQNRLEQHVACLDYSVARPSGKRVAYRC